jgi:hypothetical protein
MSIERRRRRGKEGRKEGYGGEQPLYKFDTKERKTFIILKI